MSEPKDTKPEIADPTYEDRDLDLRAIGIFAGIVLFVALITWVMMSVLFQLWKPGDIDRAVAESLPDPAGPTLQSWPKAELAQYERIHSDHLRSYSWIKTNEVAAIPIDVAMKIALQTKFGTEMDKLDVGTLHDAGHHEPAHAEPEPEPTEPEPEPTEPEPEPTEPPPAATNAPPAAATNAPPATATNAPPDDAKPPTTLKDLLGE